MKNGEPRTKNHGSGTKQPGAENERANEQRNKELYKSDQTRLR